MCPGAHNGLLVRQSVHSFAPNDVTDKEGRTGGVSGTVHGQKK